MDYASLFTPVGTGSMPFGHWFPPHVLCTLLCRFWLVYTPCGQVFVVRFADVSPGVGSLVGGEFSQSLGARLLVSALRVVGATCNIDTTCFFVFF